MRPPAGGGNARRAVSGSGPQCPTRAIPRLEPEGVPRPHPFKLLTLAILATVVFGPDKLPEMVSRAIGLLRTVRAFAENAKQDIRKELGPEFKNFEFEDLNPRTFVTKNLLSEDTLGLSEIRNGTPRQ